MKYLERIPLEQYAYAEISSEGETLEQFTKEVALAKLFYANRIFKEKEPAPFIDKAGDNMCEKCGSDFKIVPAGVSKKTGKPYNSFYACSNRECGNTKQMPKKYFGPNS